MDRGAPALMGILQRPAELIEALLPQLPEPFTVCELGNQIYRANGAKADAKVWWQEKLCCVQHVSIDANGKADVMADLNLPINIDEIGTFDITERAATISSKRPATANSSTLAVFKRPARCSESARTCAVA